ncbi:hypothetical protein C8J57DRAFT_103831 [Mycena rebaudengoi]|nr:hypothetical protein C8J57DRAFT_103831 [Mycena rebaudengoi]
MGHRIADGDAPTLNALETKNDDGYVHVQPVSAPPLIPLPRMGTNSSMSSYSRPRPRSPPTMFVAYDTKTPQTPKPLIKLEKKANNSKSRMQPKSDPPVRCQPTTAPVSMYVAYDVASPKTPKPLIKLEKKKNVKSGSQSKPDPSTSSHPTTSSSLPFRTQNRLAEENISPPASGTNSDIAAHSNKLDIAVDHVEATAYITAYSEKASPATPSLSYSPQQTSDGTHPSSLGGLGLRGRVARDVSSSPRPVTPKPGRATQKPLNRHGLGLEICEAQAGPLKSVQGRL